MMRMCSLWVLAISLGGVAGSAIAQTQQYNEKKPASTVESPPKSSDQDAATRAGPAQDKMGSDNTSESGNASEMSNSSHSGAKRHAD